MINYEEFPCSLRVSKQSAEETPHQPTVVKEIEAPRPQKYLQPPPEHVPSPVPLIAAAVASTKKKSCLSTNNSKREPPPHPALRRKTVAFGRTVNVSQTVEGTSRNHRKALASSSASSLPADQIMAEEKPEEDWRDVIKTELETMKKEMQEETTRRQEELNAQNFAKMQELMAQFFQQITIPKKPSIEEIETDKENLYDTVRQSRRQEPANKIAMARDVLKREGIISSEALIIVEQRVRSDPMFRQQIDNVLADAECDAHRAAYSPTPPISEVPHTNGAGVNPALMRETLTVERSIRFGNGLSSIDSRQWTTERNQYRPYEPDPPYQSTYQKGQSISYYPSEAVTNNRNNRPGYYLEGISDEEEETVISRRNKTNYEPIATETAAERERRIREKYARKK